MQVVPVDIEVYLLFYAAVVKAIIISVSEEDVGKRPFVFIVQPDTVITVLDKQDLKKDINQHVESALSKPH